MRWTMDEACNPLTQGLHDWHTPFRHAGNRKRAPQAPRACRQACDLRVGWGTPDRRVRRVRRASHEEHGVRAVAGCQVGVHACKLHLRAPRTGRARAR